ncbi:MAG: hypothetical protein V4722_04320 [Bacteroidota bacterium]
MASIVGKENVLWAVRYHDLPYWKIFDSENKKAAGNVAFKVSDQDAQSIELSTQSLSRAMDMLGPGRYLFTAMKSNAQDKRGGIDTSIELGVPSGKPNDAIAGIGGAGAGFFMEGIGQITPDNFEEAIEKKIKKVQEEAARVQELKNLQEELKAMKAEKTANDSSFRNGVMAIGTIAWPVLKKSPVVSELMGSIGGLVKMIDNAGGETTVDTNAEISGVDEQARAEKALEKLADNNPDFAKELEMLAKLKETNPDMYAQGLDFIKGMTD